MGLINFFVNLHNLVFSKIESMTSSWLPGLLARLTFLAVLYFYFLNSAKTKVGEGLAGFFQVSDGSYFQILGEAGMLQYEFDTANIPWYIDLVVYFGTYFEFILPILILLGLFTRIAAIGMSVFILVQTYVDITVHKVDAGTTGMLFDREATSLIMDQRALWLFVLVILILKGAGSISLDRFVSAWWQGRNS